MTYFFFHHSFFFLAQIWLIWMMKKNEFSSLHVLNQWSPLPSELSWRNCLYSLLFDQRLAQSNSDLNPLLGVLVHSSLQHDNMLQLFISKSHHKVGKDRGIHTNVILLPSLTVILILFFFWSLILGGPVHVSTRLCNMSTRTCP